MSNESNANRSTGLTWPQWQALFEANARRIHFQKNWSVEPPSVFSKEFLANRRQTLGLETTAQASKSKSEKREEYTVEPPQVFDKEFLSNRRKELGLS